MCGIFGYVGEPADLGAMLLEGLKTLQYRGYDSWGVAVATDDGIKLDKRVGAVNGSAVALPPSPIGFGHTRWATHGGVTAANAHPHLDCHGAIAVIHNGIVENHQVLREELIARGHRFRSETDSEVIAHLLEDESAAGVPIERALAAVFRRLVGLNAVIALDARARALVATKQTSPLVAGVNGRGAVIASDTLALRGHADRVVYLADEQLVRLDRDGLSLFERSSMRPVEPGFAELPTLHGNTELGAYAHFMDKEIDEQAAVLDLLAADERRTGELSAAIRGADDVVLVGCGSAAYAAIAGSYLFARIAKRQVRAVVGSEFALIAPFLTPRTLVVALSQSGETADLVEAMATAKGRGARLGAIVNVEHSTLDRLVDVRYHLGAGPEQCVLSTKSFTAKLAALLLTAHAAAGCPDEGRRLVSRAATGMRALLQPARRAEIAEIAATIAAADHLFVVGRGQSYPTALEAALKIKEASYVHAEGLAGGELKHGVIALVTKGTPCLVFAPDDETRSDMLSGAAELRSRGAWVVGIGERADPVFDRHLASPAAGLAAPLVSAVPAQLLAYHVALHRGVNPDRPRNLAKSVTVK